MRTPRRLNRALCSQPVASLVVALLCAAFVHVSSAQTLVPMPLQSEFDNLGQLLAAGGKLVSPQQFKDEVVQRVSVGILASGATVEVIHTTSGTVAGSLLYGGDRQFNTVGSQSGRGLGTPQNWPVSGTWTIDDSERICVTLQIYNSQSSSILPKRCQFWFKLGDRYYVSDSDEDRSAKLLVRVFK